MNKIIETTIDECCDCPHVIIELNSRTICCKLSERVIISIHDDGSIPNTVIPCWCSLEDSLEQSLLPARESKEVRSLKAQLCLVTKDRDQLLREVLE